MSAPDANGAEKRSAEILDWHGPFAARVMERIHEYDDAFPKRRYRDTVVRFPAPPVQGDAA